MTLYAMGVILALAYAKGTHMDSIMVGDVDATSMMLILAVTGASVFAIIQTFKVTFRARALQAGAIGRRPWWWAMTLRVSSVVLGMLLAPLVNMAISSPLGVEVVPIGFFAGLFSAGIATAVFSWLDARGIKVPASDTLSLQTARDESEDTDA